MEKGENTVKIKTKKTQRHRPPAKKLRPVGRLVVRGSLCLVSGFAVLIAGEPIPGQHWSAGAALLLGLQAVCELSISLGRPLGQSIGLNSLTPQYVISKPASSIRESWRSLPGWLQPYLTRLSGKPLVDEIANHS